MAIRIPLQKADGQRDFYPASWRSVDSDPLGAVGPGEGGPPNAPNGCGAILTINPSRRGPQVRPDRPPCGP